MYYTPNMSRCRIICEDDAAFLISMESAMRLLIP